MTTVPLGRPRTAAEVMTILHEVKDPEVPAIDVVELGIVRGAQVEGDRVTVTVTPTYSGCPATKMIEREIEAALRRHGVPAVEVRMVFQPPWTTDWISEEAKEKLRAYGIAPPGKAPAGGLDLVSLGGPTRTVTCPFCGSSNTVRQSEFGSTACKSIHTCLSCRQPFEHFKAI